MTPADAPADLSDTAALHRLRAFLPDAPVAASPLLRARMTADTLQRPRLPDDPDLREFDHGTWAGLGWEQIAARWPDLSRAYWETPGDTAQPGGESWHQGAARVSAAADRLLALGPAVIIVAHHGPILTQIARATGQTPAQVLAQPVAPLSVTRLCHDGAHWRAELINHAP